MKRLSSSFAVLALLAATAAPSLAKHPMMMHHSMMMGHSMMGHMHCAHGQTYTKSYRKRNGTMVQGYCHR